jgi:hypothetical protein
MVRRILCLAALWVSAALIVVAIGYERASNASVDRVAVLTAPTDEESTSMVGDIADSWLGAYNNFSEHQLLGLGILTLTLIVAILIAGKMLIKRNGGDTRARGHSGGYYRHYAPSESADEFRRLVRDEIEAWRTANAKKIANKADANLKNEPARERKHAHPRIVARAIEQGSWIDADDVQELWGGLLASSCTFEGSDDSNFIFIDLLSHLTVSQTRILNHICKNAEKKLSPAGWLTATSIEMRIGELQEISKSSDTHKLYLELTHLESLGLLRLNKDFKIYSASVDLEPTNLALQMYARCHGYSGNPITFFGI